MNRKTLGVIGGLGPMATAHFMKMAIEMTEADIDQEHIEMIIYNSPSIPDRTGYILNKSGKNPGEVMAGIAGKLEKDGAQVIAIPCVTATYFYRQVARAVAVPVIHTLQETADYLKGFGVDSVGLMATDGTVKSGIFERVFEENRIRTILPEKEFQKDVMHIIYQNVKAGRPIKKERFERVSDALRKDGAQVIILGCTELSMVKRDEQIGSGYLDVLQVLAKCAVEQCGTLKKEYRRLITE